MYRIGYIDEDAGQRSSFYHFLKDEFDIVLFEMNDTTTADTLVEDVFQSGIDMLVLDFRLDDNGDFDFNADSLIEKIQQRNYYYPLVILTSHELDALDHISNANLVNGKEDMLGKNVAVFKQKLSKIIQSYKSRLSEAENEVQELEKKRQSDTGLLPAEEDRYVELNNFLEKTTSAKSTIPRSFYSTDTNKKLDQLIEKTEALLSRIENKD
ncbi:hypothetical protein [Fluviicola taffensis]|uniref:Response regulatory domain-containing protein n=1 Tax=Fluviicola taffensis (strain DSM 16823 / NCIMB 13979 / RW262) TaxID=755732 RepID=F2IJU7_FLUTR|nr:hypothetical protein [Fluviicola taffensis]AEA45006.1 hypothetical protein Fluta_3029 [Fluviicola taffensis DSM 16823]